MTAVLTPITDTLIERTPVWTTPVPREAMSTVSLMVLNDQPVVRQGLADVLGSSSGIRLVGAVGTIDEALSLDRVPTANVFLVSLSHSDCDTIEGASRIRAARPDAAIVVLNGPAAGTEILRAFDAGVSGYLLTDSEPEELVAGVRAAAAGSTPLSPGAAREFLAVRRTRRSIRPLTTREYEVLDHVREGLANKQIARRLGISEKTVKAHLTRVFSALGVSDRTQAALYAEGHRAAC